ncbi:MAG: PQQ-binding-like beta-propeller repeat protein [Pirellulaceae bacterium]|nr:PQQ-binding-like beta-propeller repeat protein [Pirellulaceae bacterium]
MRKTRFAYAVSACCAAWVLSSGDLRAESGMEIIKASGVSGGLIVQIGCDDPDVTVGLRANDVFLVHALDTDAARVAKAREHIKTRGLYGPVSADTFNGIDLPYAENLVNLVVIGDTECEIQDEEIMRVLAPGGVAVFLDRQTKINNRKWVKPWPEEIDEWTHYLYDSTGNAVSRDSEAGPPRSMRWVAAPLWPRSHEYTPSISALVTSGGHIFYIMDDGVRGLFDSRFPEEWAIYARDAFNGLLLWKRPFAEWGPSQWKASGHWSTPMSLPRRLVSTDDHVYVTLGYRAPVTVLDARTGDTIRVLEETSNTDELILSDSVLLARCRKNVPEYPKGATAWDVTVRWKKAADAPRVPPAAPGDETIVAVDAETGKVMWRKPESRIVTLSLAASDGRVCYHTFEDLVCLDLASGKELWREPSQAWPDLVGTGVTLVMYGDVVLTTSSEGLIARSAVTGKQLWRGPRIPRVAPRQPADLLVADGLVWSSLTPEMPMGTVPKQRMEAPRVTGKHVLGFDPVTGEVKKSVDIGQLMSIGHHVRCYRSKATQQYLLWPKRGIEFVDIRDGEGHMRCDWTRGECSYGVMPANGLLYVPPHPCVCYTGVALNGFNALAPGLETGNSKLETRNWEDQFARGPAFNQIGNRKSAIENLAAWPTYRHDPTRSGAANCDVPHDAGPLWEVNVGGRLTQPVVSDRRLFVASADEHTVHCLDQEDGGRLWTFTAGGRIDSSPTLHRGLVLFGCRDGWVYCLRASDGELAWRFRAAPSNRRIAAFGQLESPWGVHGSVLVVGDTVYFAAGRSSFLDGGIFLYGLNPLSGKIRYQAHLDGPWPDIDNDTGQPFHMEGAKTDVLVSDGRHLFMFHNKFDLELNQLKTVPRGAGGDRVIGLRLTSTSGLLDDTWHDRFYWFHNDLWPGSHFATRGPKSGQILVFDDKTTYGQRAFSVRERLSPKFTPGRDGYLLFADLGDTEALLPGNRSGRGTEYKPAKGPKWSTHVPIRALAMVLTRNALFLAGPPDAVPEKDPYAALEGRMGAALWAVSTEDGSKLVERRLDSPPVFDGMIAADGKLYVSTVDGRLLCLGSLP